MEIAGEQVPDKENRSSLLFPYKPQTLVCRKNMPRSGGKDCQNSADASATCQTYLIKFSGAKAWAFVLLTRTSGDFYAHKFDSK